MRIEDEAVIELCRREPDPDFVLSRANRARFDWDRFLDIASRNTVSLRVLKRLSRIGIPGPRRGELSANLFAFEEHVSSRQRLMKAQLDAIGDRLRGQVEFVLLKGLSVDRSGVRECGDLDLLVRPDRVVQSVDLLRGIGYQFRGSPLVHPSKRRQSEITAQLTWNNQFELVNDEAQLLVELHTNLFHRRWVYVEDLDCLWENIHAFWSSSRYDEQLGCDVLSPECSALLMCLHVALKRSPARNTFCLRNLIDVDRACHAGFSWDDLTDQSRECRVSPYVYFTLVLSTRLLGTGVPPSVLSRLREDCSRAELRMCALHQRCLVGLDGNAPFTSTAYRVAAPFVFGKSWRDRIRWLLLIPILFPSRLALAARYELEEDSPLLIVYFLLNPLLRLHAAASRSLRRN